VAQGTGRDAAKLSWKVRDGDYPRRAQDVA
jgi:hypothetical protein